MTPADFVIVLVVALIAFGPKRFPEVRKQLEQAVRELQDITRRK